MGLSEGLRRGWVGFKARIKTSIRVGFKARIKTSIRVGFKARVKLRVMVQVTTNISLTTVQKMKIYNTRTD